MSSSRTSQAASPDAVQGSGSSNPFAALLLFVRQVIAELKKVVVPTRRELVGYSITVLAFVFAMILFVFGLDVAFGWLSRIVFVVPDAGL